MCDCRKLFLVRFSPGLAAEACATTSAKKRKALIEQEETAEKVLTWPDWFHRTDLHGRADCRSCRLVLLLKAPLKICNPALLRIRPRRRGTSSAAEMLV